MNFEFLLLLAKKGAIERFAQLTTVELAAELDVSQQTASRWVQKCIKNGEVEKTPAGLKLSNKSIQALRQINSDLNSAFYLSKDIRLTGNVMTGLGEGAYYLSRPGYVKQIADKLGFEPFAGTLDIRLESAQDVSKKIEILKRTPVRLESFKEEKRFFGGVSCYPCLINSKVKGAILQPDRTHHGQDVAEVIAPVNLRKELNLKEKSKVKITLL